MRWLGDDEKKKKRIAGKRDTGYNMETTLWSFKISRSCVYDDTGTLCIIIPNGIKPPARALSAKESAKTFPGRGLYGQDKDK